MKRLYKSWGTLLASWATVACCFEPAIAADQSLTLRPRTRKPTITVRAQNNDSAANVQETVAGTVAPGSDASSTSKPAPTLNSESNTGHAKPNLGSKRNLTSAVSDEDLFDSMLIRASNQISPSVPCVSVPEPNCSSFALPPNFSNESLSNLPPSSTTSPSDPSLPSQQNLNNPLPQTNNQNAPQTQTPQFASNADVVPFIGDFFGGAMLSGSSVGAYSSIGQFVENSNGEFLQIRALSSLNPGYFETVPGVTATRSPSGEMTVSYPDGHTQSVQSNEANIATNVTVNPPASPNSPLFNARIFSSAGSASGGLDPGVITGRTKLAEGSSPIPRDRVFMNYSNFNNVFLGQNPISVNRYTPGFEKTYFNGVASIEVRIPFASTMTSNVDPTTGFINPTNMLFGNMTFYNKALLYQNRSVAISTGLGLTVPTANNINVFSGGAQTLHLRNDSVHLLPFIGGVYTPNDRWFNQGLVQFDFDANGNRVFSNTDLQGNQVVTPTGDNALAPVGIFRDATYIYASISSGYWMYKSQTPGPFGVTGIAPTGELHYNRNLQNGNQIVGHVNDGTPFTIFGQNFTNIEVLNAVMGVNARFGNNRILTLGYSTPLGMGVDKQFASEFRVMFNWYFGGGNSSPLTRVGATQFFN